MLGMTLEVVVLVCEMAVLLGVLGLVFVTLFSSVLALAGWLLSGKAIIIGIIIGYLAVRYLRNRNTNKVQNG